MCCCYCCSITLLVLQLMLVPYVSHIYPSAVCMKGKLSVWIKITSVLSPIYLFSLLIFTFPFLFSLSPLLSSPLVLCQSHTKSTQDPKHLMIAGKRKKRWYNLQGKSITEVKEVTRTIREWLHLQNFSNLTFVTAK